MSALKTTGLQLAIGSTLGTQFTVSAITNANPAVATLSSSHGVVVNDIIVLSSGWKRLNNRVVRVSAVSTNDVTLEGIDTSSTADYPAGEGVGTGQEVTVWTPITKLRPDITTSGGGFEQLDGTEVDDVRRISIPGLAEPVSLTFPFHWPADSSWQSKVETAARSGSSVPYRIGIGTKRVYGAAFWGFNNSFNPQNSIAVGSIQLSTVADDTYYAT